MFWENFRALTDGGQFIEISKRAKTEHVGELVNTFYPTNDPQTIEFAKVISMNPAPKNSLRRGGDRRELC